MRIVTLIENTSDRKELMAEHGLSLYLEVGDRKILFDAGQSGQFADNAKKLGINLADVDTAVLSHGHYDHGDGFLRFFEENKTAQVYAAIHVFEPHFNACDRNIGLTAALRNNDRFVYVNDFADLGDGISLYSAASMSRTQPFETYGLQVVRNGQMQPEDFCHELYLLVQNGEKRICITGCAHMGILNIVEHFEPDVVIGGFHFKPLPPDSAELFHAADKLSQHPRLYYSGHCTGAEQYAVLKRKLGNRLHPLSTGTIIEL